MREALTSARHARRPGKLTKSGVALQADDVVEAELAEKVEQLGVGQAGQDGDPDAGGQHLGQPTQAGILIVVAGILQLVLEHAEPDQRRRPAVTSLSARGPSAAKSVQSIATTRSGPDQFRNPGGKDIPGLKLAIAQQP